MGPYISKRQDNLCVNIIPIITLKMLLINTFESDQKCYRGSTVRGDGVTLVTMCDLLFICYFNFKSKNCKNVITLHF